MNQLLLFLIIFLLCFFKSWTLIWTEQFLVFVFMCAEKYEQYERKVNRMRKINLKKTVRFQHRRVPSIYVSASVLKLILMQKIM